jgi:transposase
MSAMYFGGIDAHAASLMVAVVDQVGQRVLAPTRISVRKPERLVEVLRPFRPLRVVVETCPFWPWTHDRLTSEGIGFALAHAKRLRAIAEADHKSDALDAELLARLLQAGLIPEVHPKAKDIREQARLVRHRALLVRHRTMLLNRIHAQLHPAGLSLPRGRLGTKKGRAWLGSEALPQLDAEQQCLVRTHLRLLDTLTPMIRSLDARIEAAGAKLPAVSLLRTIPGIGSYSGLLLATEVLPIERFERPEHLVSYAGLAPRTRSSGGKVHRGPIPKGANRWIRGVLVRAVVSHCRQTKQSSLSRYYAQQKERLGWPTARVAAARKLCRALYRMLQTGEVWRG